MNKNSVPEVGCALVVLALAVAMGVIGAMLGPGEQGYYMDPLPNTLFRGAVLLLVFGIPGCLFGFELLRRGK